MLFSKKGKAVKMLSFGMYVMYEIREKRRENVNIFALCKTVSFYA